MTISENQKKIFSLSTIFLSSALIMILEIIGAKLIGPVFGSSHYVWMSQITVTLLSISLGGFLSTFLKKEHGYKIIIFNLISQLYLLLALCFFDKISQFLINLPFLYGSLSLSVILYFLPLTGLSIVFPFLIDNFKEELKLSVGKISALSTLGSVLGTLLSGVLLIRFLTNFEIIACVSIFTCIYSYFSLRAFFLSMPKMGKKEIALSKAAVSLVIVSILIKEGVVDKNKSDIKVLETMNTHFGEVVVIEKDDKRAVVTDLVSQAKVSRSTGESAFDFSYVLINLSLGVVKEPKKALHIGLGAGVVPKFFHTLGIQNTVIEINPAILLAAQKYFDFSAKDNKTIIQDGRFFLKTNNEKFDIVVLDAFNTDSVPLLLLSKEALIEIKRSLNPGGVLVVNTFGSLEPVSMLSKSIVKTSKEVFKNVRVYNISPSSNVYFAISDKAIPEISLTRGVSKDVELNARAEEILTKPHDLSGVLDSGIILSDNNSRIDTFFDNTGEFFRRRLLLGTEKTNPKND